MKSSVTNDETSMNSYRTEELIKYFNGIDENGDDFYRFLVLGEQVYRTILYGKLFEKVTQNAKLCRRLVRKLPEEELLFDYLKTLRLGTIVESEEYGITTKIRKAFVLLGVNYQLFGYDSVFTIFDEATSSYLETFLEHPILDYTRLLESYSWNKYHLNLKYQSRIAREYSSKDIVFESSTVYRNHSYSAFGYSKKHSTENLSKVIFNDLIRRDKDLLNTAISQGYKTIDNNSIVFDSGDYYEKDQRISAFAEKYNCDPLLIRFALLTRSQAGKDVWERLDVQQAELLHSKASQLKNGLIDWGRELLLLQILSYALKNHYLDSIDLSALDTSNSLINNAEAADQLMILLKLDDFSELLAKQIELPVVASLTKKDLVQLSSGVIAVVFLCNYSPEKKFSIYFGDVLNSFYNAERFDSLTDYRFLLSSYMSMFNDKIGTNHHEIGDGIFHAELIVNSDDLQKICFIEDESMRFAKSQVWEKAYKQIVVPVIEFFTTAKVHDSKAEILYFIKNVIKFKEIPPMFFSRFGILAAKNLNDDNLTAGKLIFKSIRSFVSEPELLRFINIINQANKHKYVCGAGSNVFLYEDWLNSSAGLTEQDYHRTASDIAAIYNQIVNPSAAIQKAYIDEDYHNVQYISPLSDDVAKYALDISIDAFGYLQDISLATMQYYARLKAEYERYADIGTLTSNLGSEAEITILDSHKPLHMQIQSLISSIELKKITIACGYCFASGLSLLKDIIEPSLSANVPFELYVGALQNYDETSNEHLITGIDKNTIRKINQYLSFLNFKLFTCPDRFYHGKIYLLEGEYTTYIIIGSSNVSRSAFITNYELNLAFKVSNNNPIKENFCTWIRQLRYYSKQINHLDENSFGSNEIKQDGSILIKHITPSSMRNRIRDLTDAEVQYRLKLWMSYDPDIIAEDLGILSLPNYFVFVYKKVGLIVLESFTAGNAYYCIKTADAFEEVINTISTFSKTEIFEYSKMTKRGYHIQSKFTLESNIRWFFREVK